VDVIDDRGGDGVPDLILGCWNDVFIKDSVTGEILWTRTRNDGAYDNPFTDETFPEMENTWNDDDRIRYIVVGDTNGDGTEDLVAATHEELMFLHSNISASELDYAAAFVSAFEDGLDRENVVSVGDLNGNGAEDVVFQKYVKDANSVFTIVDGRNGYNLLETERSGTRFDMDSADFNGNGFGDFIIFYMWTEGGGPKLEVIDGRTRDTILSYNGIEESWMLREIFGYSTVMPAAPVGDMNGGGGTDIAIVRAQAWQQGAEVVIHDVKNNEEISKIVVQDTDRSREGDSRWVPGIMAEKLSDVNGDGYSELGIIAATGEEHSKEVKMFIIDAANSEIIADFGTVGKEILDLEGENVGIVGSSGNIYFLDISKDLRITSPASGAVVGSPVTVEWEGASESVATVMVDSQRTSMTSDSSASFEILTGDHKITVYTFDKYGKGVYDSIDVTVEKSSSATMIVTIVVIILLGLLFSPKLLLLLGRMKR
jgi:hypothetical protein